MHNANRSPDITDAIHNWGLSITKQTQILIYTEEGTVAVLTEQNYYKKNSKRI